MIDWLEIHHLAIAEHIQLEFGNSFTAVTGETGSGKSLIVDAVGILLGDRCENSVIRHQQEKAEIVGGFRLDESHPALQWLLDNGLDNDNECILRRVVRRNKPSRAFINSHAVNASQLREIGHKLVDIHGQNEHHSLLSKKGQLSLLDHAAGNTGLLAQLGENYEKLTSVGHQIEQLNKKSDSDREKASLLQLQIHELEALDPAADEWSQLELQQKRMHHFQDLVAAARAVADRLTENENDNISASLAYCNRQLQHLVEYDPQLARIITLLEEADVVIDEAAKQLQSCYGDRLLNPEEIAEIDARFSLFHELSRKYRILPGLLGEKLEQLRAELPGLKDPEAELKRLHVRWIKHKEDYDKLAGAISKNRSKTAKFLAAKVTALMQELAMAGGSFELRLKPAGDNPTGKDTISRHGNETVEFMVSTNPGLPLQPLGKVASGGELSRISLAINVILAGDAAISTLIFDEVDVGIGGKVAEIVGQKLRRLGENRQVICITHLSQVAAKGHHHWSVTKHSTDDNIVRQANVSVQPLDDRQRIEEIARMTAGAELTPQSLAHAEQLLQSA